ncbi:type IV pilus twitching motility protein PilT [Cellulomonas sp. NPDC089187]|uniref:type IV pilus twitching motility protein PilT n=1 Tax=Cellulomonas sp. NPDC089187 TaxID=3154970 RepID=UPI0034477B5B
MTEGYSGDLRWSPLAEGVPGGAAEASEQPGRTTEGLTAGRTRPGEARMPVQPGPAAPVDGVGARSAAPVGSRAAMRSQGRVGMGHQRREQDVVLDEILIAMVQAGASDLHLTVGAPPTIRLSGELRPLPGFDAPLEAESLRRSLFSVLTQKHREKFEQELELDLSYSVRGHARFRVNLYQQRESIGAAFRVIPYEIKPLEELGLPPVVANFAGLPRGMVLVTGPTGSGKSTTLASIIDLANRTRAEHIMTVEDPIEFLHRHKKALINQREVGEDTHSFAAALKHVLRQDPDIILVGEMRDLETISVALTAAETGHLVFATLHTQDAAQTIDRIIDVFPAHQQAQVRTQLAGAIQGVVCQTLAKRADGPGRQVATEVMVATPAIRNLIREGKTHQIYSAMQAGAQQGMHTMDQQLAELVKSGRISYETGLEKSHHAEDFNRLSGRFGVAAGPVAQGGMPAQDAMYSGYGQTGSGI